jgi:hypothetical protein
MNHAESLREVTIVGLGLSIAAIQECDTVYQAVLVELREVASCGGTCMPLENLKTWPKNNFWHLASDRDLYGAAERALADKCIVLKLKLANEGFRIEQRTNTYCVTHGQYDTSYTDYISWV